MHPNSIHERPEGPLSVFSCAAAVNRMNDPGSRTARRLFRAALAALLVALPLAPARAYVPSL